MLHRTIHTGLELVPDSLNFSAARNTVWGVTADGGLVAIRLFDARVSTVGSGYTDPVGVVPLSDGLRLGVAESGGAVYVVRRDAANHAQARELAQAPGAVLSGQILQDLADGRPTSLSLARPGDNSFGTAITQPAPLR